MLNWLRGSKFGVCLLVKLLRGHVHESYISIPLQFPALQWKDGGGGGEIRMASVHILHKWKTHAHTV